MKGKIKLLEFNNVSITLLKDGRPIVKDFTFVLHQGEKIAIIGEEGNGKSTLLKSVVHRQSVEKYATVKGTINTQGKHIGYLEQALDPKWNNEPTINFFLKDFPDDELDYDNYNLINDIYSYIAKFGLRESILDDNEIIGNLSGGEKVKLQIIKILCHKPDILLMDEPTNDIDIDTLEWLENFINNASTPILYVSHDETLLDHTATGIIHLEQIKRKTECRHTIAYVPYKEYIDQRIRRLSHQEQVAKKERSDYNKQMAGFREVYQKVEHQQNTITRADPHGAALLKKKMKSLKSQEKRYEREKSEFVEMPDVEEAINLQNANIEKIPNGKNILNLALPSLTVNGNELAKNINLMVFGREHIVIIGHNGSGKTTLIKHIYDILQQKNDIKLGYMPQDYEDLLDAEMSPIDLLTKNNKTKEFMTKARTYLGSLKFTPEEVTNKIKYLSGGQKAKLLLLKLILDEANVLILDEPTRNLSPLSNPVIRKLLQDFPGTIISVSHDRKYIEEVCNKIYELTPNGLIFRNTYKKNNQVISFN